MRPLYEILEKDHMVIANLSKEEITARAADKFIAGKLNLDVGSPILAEKGLFLTRESAPSNTTWDITVPIVLCILSKAGDSILPKSSYCRRGFGIRKCCICLYI